MPKDLSPEGKRAVDDLASALNGHDPRARILQGVKATAPSENIDQ